MPLQHRYMALRYYNAYRDFWSHIQPDRQQHPVCSSQSKNDTVLQTEYFVANDIIRKYKKFLKYFDIEGITNTGLKLIKLEKSPPL